MPEGRVATAGGSTVPSDTAQLLTGGRPDSAAGAGGSAPGGKTAGSGETAFAALASGGGGASGYDTILGRLVVDQGLATQEEVESALARRRAAADPNRSLAELLVESEYVTKRQLARLRQLAEAERSGQQIPGYKVIGKVGAGAMAAVFKAKQLSLDRMVAIKVLPRKFSTNKQFIERFYAEGRAAAQLNHPNIVQAIDVGQAGEFHYFVMEFVEGKTVHDLIEEQKKFKEQDAVDIIINVADALRHAHDKGLIHRDVKPKNIIITPSGIAKLADLGLAREIDDKEAALAEKGKAFGTPYYISPEQIRGEVNIGPQADIYSLGATLYHMVTGAVPFNGKNPAEVMQKHLKEALVPPDHVNPKLSAGISEVIEMMMSKSRRTRYKNCADLLVDLRAVRRGELPPIAHKEASASVLAELAQQSASQPLVLAESSREPSPFRHPKVQVLVWIVIGAVAYAVGVTVLAVMLLASGDGP